MNQTGLLDNLTPMLSGKELTDALALLPDYDPAIRNADTTDRLLGLSNIYNVYVPSRMSEEIYNKLYISLVHSLQKKDNLDAVRQYAENFRAIKQMPYSGILGGNDSFTIIGASGIGKSSAISRAISLICERGVIETKRPFRRIIPCIVIQCPFDASVKGLLFEVLRKVDEALGTEYYNNAIRARSTTDMLIGSVSQVALNHIGVLVVDEIQNIVNSKNGKQLVGVLTQLINNSAIAIAMVGIPECNIFFEQAMQLARRSLGLYYTSLPFDDRFAELCSVLYSYQYVKNKVALSGRIVEWLYEHSGGIVAILVSLIHDAQEIAIIEGSEMLDLSSLSRAYNERLALMHQYISPVSSHGKKTSSVSKKTVPKGMQESKSVGSIQTVDFVKLASIAKAQNLDLAALLKDRVTLIEVEL